MKTVLALLLSLAASVADAQTDSADLKAARAVFEANLNAIRNRERAAYLSYYWNSEKLSRTGPEGTALGFESFAANAGENWPDTFEARDLQLVSIQPGVVYGTYRYRVRYGADEHSGISERLFLSTPAGWKIAVTTAFDAPAGTPPPPAALTGATLLDGNGGAPVADSVVVVRGGKVDCAGSRQRCPVPEGITRIDVTGKWITPGVIDAHVHFSQTGWADGRPDSIDVRERYPYEKTVADLKANPERFFRSYLCSGVTSVFDVGGYPWTIELTGRVENDTRAPRVAAAGPLLSTRDHWLNLPAERQFLYLTDENSARAGVRYLAEHGADAVKVWYLNWPERPAASTAAFIEAAADEAKRRGLPLIVHATGLEEAKIATRAGAHLLVHSVWDNAIDDELVALMKANGTIYCPTLTVRGGYLEMYRSAVTDRPPRIDDPNGCVDAGTRAKVNESVALPFDGNVETIATRKTETDARAAAHLRRVLAAGVTVAMGTDAGNPLTLHGPSVYAEMEAMGRAGMTPMQVLVASTRNSAAAMRRENDLGTLEAGKHADLLILDADPIRDIANMRRLRQVMRGGVLRSIEELRAVVEAGKP